MHASYDRVFQTPSSENILLSSSSQIVSLNPNVLRLPVEPVTRKLLRGWRKQMRSSASFGLTPITSVAMRNNFADDDQILSTAVSFPIAFRQSR